MTYQAETITNRPAAQPRTTAQKQTSAIGKLMMQYRRAQEATRSAVIEEQVIGEALKRAMSPGANLAEAIIPCARCEEWFVKVPSANDDRYAHCPKCGEPHEMDAVAGSETQPHEFTGYGDEGEA